MEQNDGKVYIRAAALAWMNMGDGAEEAYRKAEAMWQQRQQSERILNQYLADQEAGNA